jgi:hypothetical protein
MFLQYIFGFLGSYKILTSQTVRYNSYVFILNFTFQLKNEILFTNMASQHTALSFLRLVYYFKKVPKLGFFFRF